jgi:hypothetical protein
MNRFSRIAALLAGVGLVALSQTALAQGGETLKLVERATTDVVTDTGETGDTAGDILTFANEIYDEANEKQLGTDNGWCVRTAVGKSWECFWTLMLDGGQITVEGPFLDAGDSVLAITGGAGSYSGVSGERALHARNAEGSDYDFVYTLSR